MDVDSETNDIYSQFSRLSDGTCTPPLRELPSKKPSTSNFNACLIIIVVNFNRTPPSRSKMMTIGP